MDFLWVFIRNTHMHETLYHFRLAICDRMHIFVSQCRKAVISFFFRSPVVFYSHAHFYDVIHISDGGLVRLYKRPHYCQTFYFNQHIMYYSVA